MRFDPKLVQSEDAPLDIDGEINLPDDLVELASQLHDDAAFLALRYPAQVVAQVAAQANVVTPAPVKELPARWSASRRQGWLVATASAALVLLVVTSLSSPTNDAARTLRESAASPTLPMASPVTAPVIASPHIPQDLPRLPVRTAPAAMFLNGVSGPELEGLLDLWQNEHETDTRISI